MLFRVVSFVFCDNSFFSLSFIVKFSVSYCQPKTLQHFTANDVKNNASDLIDLHAKHHCWWNVQFLAKSTRKPIRWFHAAMYKVAHTRGTDAKEFCPCLLCEILFEKTFLDGISQGALVKNDVLVFPVH